MPVPDNTSTALAVPAVAPGYYSMTPGRINVAIFTSPARTSATLSESWGRSGRYEYDIRCGYALLSFYHFA